MRVAFVGKGGSGKSAIAGTFARALAQRGEPVLTIDSDPMPGLAYSLGAELTEAGLPDDAVVEKAEGEDGPRFRLRPGLSALDAIEQYAARGPDGIRCLQIGKLRSNVANQMRSQWAFRQILDGFPDDSPWSVVGDLPGGTRQPFAGWGDYAHVFVAVVEPSAKSIMAARRLVNLSRRADAPREMVAVVSKARRPDDAQLVHDRTGLRIIGTVPWDEAFAEAERSARAPIDAAPESDAVKAVQSLVDQLSEEYAP